MGELVVCGVRIRNGRDLNPIPGVVWFNRGAGKLENKFSHGCLFLRIVRGVFIQSCKRFLKICLEKC